MHPQSPRGRRPHSSVNEVANHSEHEIPMLEQQERYNESERESLRANAREWEERCFTLFDHLMEKYILLRCLIRTGFWFPPALILGVLCFSYYVLVYLFCYQQLLLVAHAYVLATIICLIFHVLFILTLTSFYRAIYTCPGVVPESFYEKCRAEQMASTEGSDEDIYVRDRAPGSSSYAECRHCKKPKPPRSHHCRHCGQCIRKMDHHCPVINNCVGWGNYKFFVLLLTWADVMCFFGAFCGVIKFILIGFTDSIAIELQIVIGLFLSVAYSFMLAVFAGMHYRMVLQNVGTLDRLVPLVQTGPLNPYDMGARANFEQVFGKDPMLWFLPVATTQGDGIHFPTNDQSPHEDHLFLEV